MDTYYVTRIEEPDFGCEGRPEGQEIKDKVYLEYLKYAFNEYYKIQKKDEKKLYLWNFNNITNC